MSEYTELRWQVVLLIGRVEDLREACDEYEIRRALDAALDGLEEARDTVSDLLTTTPTTAPTEALATTGEQA